jgi:hypothetical protein
VTCHPFCPCRWQGLPVYGDNLDLTSGAGAGRLLIGSWLL